MGDASSTEESEKVGPRILGGEPVPTPTLSSKRPKSITR